MMQPSSRFLKIIDCFEFWCELTPKTRASVLSLRIRGTGGEGRRHNKQIIKEKHVNTSMRDGVLLNRNATTKNMLPSEKAESDTVNHFKA